MQAVALALVACVALWSMTQERTGGEHYRRLLRILWLLLAIYLLSPVFVFGWAFLPMLLM